MNDTLHTATDEREFQDQLAELLLDDTDVSKVLTFGEAGMMTRNKGLVVRLPNGAVFQLTIVQSRNADE